MFDRWQGHHYLIVMLPLCDRRLGTGALLDQFDNAGGVVFLARCHFEVSCINAGGNMMMLWLHKEKVGSYVTILHLCYSSGCMLAPLILVFAEWTGAELWRGLLDGGGCMPLSLGYSFYYGVNLAQDLKPEPVVSCPQ